MKHFLECEEFFGDGPNALIKCAYLYGQNQRLICVVLEFSKLSNFRQNKIHVVSIFIPVYFQESKLCVEVRPRFIDMPGSSVIEPYQFKV